VASRGEAVTGTLPIVDLVAACSNMQAVNQQLFERLGGWVALTGEPGAQQLFAVACHRHAWHAELWAERLPTIELEDELEYRRPPSGGDGLDRADVHARLAWYRDQLDALHAAVHDIEARIEPLLDPGTWRVINLVTADLEELRQRASR
jgi:hypothetical protein